MRRRPDQVLRVPLVVGPQDLDARTGAVPLHLRVLRLVVEVHPVRAALSHPRSWQEDLDRAGRPLGLGDVLLCHLAVPRLLAELPRELAVVPHKVAEADVGQEVPEDARVVLLEEGAERGEPHAEVYVLRPVHVRPHHHPVHQPIDVGGGRNGQAGAARPQVDARADSLHFRLDPPPHSLRGRNVGSSAAGVPEVVVVAEEDPDVFQALLTLTNDVPQAPVVLELRQGLGALVVVLVDAPRALHQVRRLAGQACIR
mmetsp:Transcript_97385/g.258709  ORF Transcript_97385/g.258709 Transcript_97385/m.258709 type:complete len:256 (-) Transcript_97385:397-1164(-)